MGSRLIIASAIPDMLARHTGMSYAANNILAIRLTYCIANVYRWWRHFTPKHLLNALKAISLSNAL